MAEDGDPSVVYVDGEECTTNTEPVSKPRKKSTSHVVLLKERTKRRILGKPEGPSCTPSSPVVRADSDVAPAKVTDFLSGLPDDLGPQTEKESVEAVERYRMYQNATYEDPMLHPVARENIKRFAKSLGLAFLPVEDSTAINQQARQVISKVPTSKPHSELARLENSQLKNTKKKD